MNEPTERDRESAAVLAARAGLARDTPGCEVWINACLKIIATAREEGRREERNKRAQSLGANAL